MTASVLLPSTGELLSLDDINGRLVELSRTLDASSADLVVKVRELGSVTYLYDSLHNATVASSDATSEDRRKAEAWAACAAAPAAASSETLGRAKARLEVQVRALRDGQHNIRAQMSALQTVASNLRALLSLGNVGGGA